MRGLKQDLSFGWRLLGRNPAFAAVVVVTLALGISANTTVFSIVNAVILRSLPYRDPSRLVVVWETNTARGLPLMVASPPNFADLRDQNRVFSELAAYRTRDFTLSGTGDPEQLSGASVSGDMTALLGVAPLLGRGFTMEDDRPGAPATVILSHGLWQRRFGGSRAILEETLVLNGEPHRVIGVMPAGFDFPPPISFKGDPQIVGAELWTPLRLSIAPNQRSAHNLFVIGRLRDGATLAEAQADLAAIAERLARDYPASNAGWGLTAAPLDKEVTGRLQTALLLLAGAVGLVLLIVCANVANLLLARGMSRQREFAVRSALGASRLRLLRQSLVESLLLSMLGGALGLLLASAAIRAIILVGPQNIYRLDSADIDLRVAGFALLISLATAVICGLIPALQGSRINLVTTLKEGGATTDGAGRRRWRNLLVVAEMALSVVLLVAAGLLLRSLYRLQSLPLGFKPEQLTTFTISLPPAYKDGSERMQFFETLTSRLSTFPGVESVAYSDNLPLGSNRQGTSFEVEGRPAPPPGQEHSTNFSSVSPEYFRALGITLLEGRHFTSADHNAQPRVVIVNRTLAERFFPGESAVGKRLRIFASSDSSFEIVGVVVDERHESLQAELRPNVYLPYAQFPVRLPMRIFIRSKMEAGEDVGPLISAVRREVRALDPGLPVYDVRTMSDVLAGASAQPRFMTFLLLTFAGCALLLAAIGIYGVMAYLVTQHTREIGLRMALGAEPRDILLLIVTQGLGLAVAGVAIGLFGALTLARLLSSQLYGISAYDPLTLIAVAALLLIVALAASLLPARRAMKIDPMIALRYE